MEQKPGYKTTEFWLSALTTLVGTLWASGAMSPESADAVEKVIGLIVGAVANVGYAISRGLAKAQVAASSKP